jgi:hypothetical protein
MMILLWGLENDSPLQLVRRALEARSAPHFFLNQALILESEIEVEYATETTGKLHVKETSFPLEDLQSMYLRPYDFREFPYFQKLETSNPTWRKALNFEDILWGYADVTKALVINRPSAMQSNSSKPFQGRISSELGFLTPETLLTNDKDKVIEFKNRHQKVIYKSISGSRSIVKTLEDNVLQQLNDLKWCPTQFQAYIPGIEYRAHVIGEQVFSCRVLSEATDYRYGSAHYEPAPLPGHVGDRCIRLSQSLGLHLAGIDLKQSPDGSWYVFEVNPSPAYSVYEIATNQPISVAIANLLSRGL